MALYVFVYHRALLSTDTVDSFRASRRVCPVSWYGTDLNLRAPVVISSNGTSGAPHKCLLDAISAIHSDRM